MHNNFYFLRQLSAILGNILTGTVVSECYSQSKDEIIIRFETTRKSFYITASLNPSFSILSFPENVERARRNSIDLFPEIIGFRVTGIRQLQNERSFALLLEESKALLFKMHGNRSNLILFENDIATTLFKNNLVQDAELTLNGLDRSTDWSFETFSANQHQPEKIFFTFGKLVWSYLREQGYDEGNIDRKWKLIQDVIQKLERPDYYLCRIKDSLHLSLLPLQNCAKTEGNAFEISNRFFQSYAQEFTLEREKAAAISALRNKLQGSLSYYEKNFKKLSEIESDTNYKNWADLIMAYMHELKQGMEKVTLPDFYNHGHFVEIKLKKELSPQHNAALYYRKAKNQHIETDKLQQALTAKEREIEKLKKEIDEVSAIGDLKQLRKRTGSTTSSTEKTNEPVPYHEFEMNGFRILVRKNAVSNDVLTMRFAYKEDLWLHAKDVTGSHVIIKYQSGKAFPKDVIERAAQLAAYNSKRKTETLCPVTVTPRKFVRKRKGDPAGAVVVEREDVIMVEPKL